MSEKDLATHSSALAWRTPWTEEPGGLQESGVTQNQTRLKRLSSNSCVVNLETNNSLLNLILEEAEEHDAVSRQKTNMSLFSLLQKVVLVSKDLWKERIFLQSYLSGHLLSLWLGGSWKEALVMGSVPTWTLNIAPNIVINTNCTLISALLN